ncbi:MAG TPA: M15 family metallopeptidase [Puia sp.]
MNTSVKPAYLTAFFLIYSFGVFAQKLPVSPYGLTYINTIPLYKASLRNHPEKQMVSLSNIPGIVLDLRYAGNDNFLHRNLYPENTRTTFLRKQAYEALDSVNQELAKRGIVLVIFDAYRPYSVTIDLWNSVKDERYAANPAKGSGHNRGISVDLTLADAKTHKLLPMPTGFDNFSDTAYQDFNKVDSKRITNRELLKHLMEKYGFIPLFSEWWHYSWPETGEFEVLDLSFQDLNVLQTN